MEDNGPPSSCIRRMDFTSARGGNLAWKIYAQEVNPSDLH